MTARIHLIDARRIFSIAKYYARNGDMETAVCMLRDALNLVRIAARYAL